jgi:hypothetical protein
MAAFRGHGKATKPELSRPSGAGLRARATVDGHDGAGDH